MSRASLSRLSQYFYDAAVLTLPLVGVGCVQLATGQDTGAGFQPSYLCLACALLSAVFAWGPRGLWSQVTCERAWLRIWLATLGAILLSGSGLILHPAEATGSLHLMRFLKQTFQVIIMICFAIAPLVWTRGSGRWSLLVRLLGAALVFELIYSAVQAVHFHRPLAFYTAMDRWFTSNPSILAGSEELFLAGQFRGIPRVRGTMCEPLYLGNFLLLVVPVLAYAYRKQSWGWLSSAAGFLLLLLTWARGAYLGAGVALLTAIVLLRRSRTQIPWAVWSLRFAGLGLVAAAGVAVVWGTDHLLFPWHRVLQSFHTEDWSNLTRLYSMQAGVRAFLVSPLIGVGWGQFAFHFPLLVDPLGLQSQFAWPVVNNFPLQILCETGLVGYGVFLAGAGWLGWKVWLAVSPQTAAGRDLGVEGRLRVVALAAASAGVWSQLMTFSQYNLPHIWVSLGLLVAALRSNEAENASTSMTNQTSPRLTGRGTSDA